MAKIKSKGTVLQLSIASTYTTIAAVRSITSPAAEVGTYDATALDSGVGREHKVTGYVEGGSCMATIWLDPVAVTHQAVSDLVTAPVDGSAWKIIWADAAPTTWSFSGPVKKFGPFKADLNEGVSGDIEVKLDGYVSYPT